MRGVIRFARPYLTPRMAVGYLGIGLPFVLAAGNRLFFAGGMEPSVSDYFYSHMRGVLVVSLCVFGAYLLAERGRDRRERLLTKMAGIGAAGVALFPAPPSHPSAWATMVGYGHLASGTLLFSSLAVIVLWLFRRANPDSARARFRRLTNRIHLSCGITMVTTLALTGLAALPLAAGLDPMHPVFWMETASIAAFGISWLVRGRMPLIAAPLLARGG